MMALLRKSVVVMLLVVVIDYLVWRSRQHVREPQCSDVVGALSERSEGTSRSDDCAGGASTHNRQSPLWPVGMKEIKGSHGGLG